MSNGYIQINIGGKLRGLKFGMLAVEGIVMEGAKSKEKSGSIPAIQTAYNMIYHGLLNNCEAKMSDPDFTLEDVMDWTDELSTSDEGAEALGLVTKAFVESRALQIINQKADEIIDASKKKKTRKKIL